MADYKSKALDRLNQLQRQLSSQHVDFPHNRVFEDSLRLDGQAYYLTGGASGLGKAFTIALASRGAFVAFLDADGQNGTAMESELRKQGYSVKFVETDVTSWAAQVAALETAIRHAPNHRIDHFIANAGVSGHNLTESMKPNPAGPDSIGPPEPIFTAINVSLIGSYYTLCLASHHFINAPEWKAHSQLDRSVVLLGSMSSYRSIPHGTDYAAAKMGMRGLFTSARETMFLRKLKIRVNMFSPQFIETAMNTQTRQWYERGGYQFGDINDAVTAFLRIVGDTSIRGRSISMNKEGIHDMDDDAGGSDGQVQVQRLLSQGLLPSWNH